MGQYHRLVNPDASEHVDPYKVGAMSKAWEQVSGGIPAALTVLLAHNPGNMPADLGNHQATGRWAGQRVLVVGDYAKRADIRGFKGTPLDEIYRLCRAEEPKREDYKRHSYTNVYKNGKHTVEHKTPQQQYNEAAKYFAKLTKKHSPIPDISPQFVGLLEDVLSIRFYGECHTAVPVENYAVKGDVLAHYMMKKGTSKEDRRYYFRMCGLDESLQYPDSLPGGRWPWDRAPGDLAKHNFTIAQADQGQRRVFANLDKREFFDPAAFGEQPTVAGIMHASHRAGQQIMAMDMVMSGAGDVREDVKSGSQNGIGSASCLYGMLLHPDVRGGGDISPEQFPEIGRWRNNRLLLSSEYGGDFPSTEEIEASFTNITSAAIKATAILARDD